MADALPKVKTRLEELYNEYSPAVDKQLFIQLVKNFIENQDQQFIPQYLADKLLEFKNDYIKLADDLYNDVDLFQNGYKVLTNLSKSPNWYGGQRNEPCQPIVCRTK